MSASSATAAGVLAPPSVPSRIYGLGSIFAKALRDSRRATLVAGIGVGLILLATIVQFQSEFSTAQDRLQAAALSEQLPPIIRGLLGEPINLLTLGGFLSWRTLNFVPLMLGVWSIVALSGTISMEARRGSMDLVASSPIPRSGIAIQKGAGHLVSMVVACLIAGMFAWLGTIAFASLPGDELPVQTVMSHMAWVALAVVAPGLVAWVLAPITGRGMAAGVGAVVLIVSYVIYSYGEAFTGLQSLAPLSYFSWTAGHRPMAGVSDWTAVGVLALVEAGLFAAGVLVFRARDIGITVSTSLPLPRIGLGLGSVLSRSFAERLPIALAFGLGLGVMGLIFALNAQSLIETMGNLPQLQEIYRRFFPDIDVFSLPGVLQLSLFGFGSLVMVGAAAMAAGGWASDETDLRLEMIMAAPISRFGWVMRSGLGVLAALAVMALALAVLVALGVVVAGGDPVNPILGSFVLGLYAAALAGVGLAVGGWIRPVLAAIVPAALGLGFYLLDLLGSVLQLPRVILDLSLPRHLGQPMAGSFDLAGIVLCAVLAIGGVVLAGVGFGRRDVER
jgi:ABC-2 type transport system permease protein